MIAEDLAGFSFLLPGRGERTGWERGEEAAFASRSTLGDLFRIGFAALAKREKVDGWNWWRGERRYISNARGVENAKNEAEDWRRGRGRKNLTTLLKERQGDG